jgi:hypothetical protein
MCLHEAEWPDPFGWARPLAKWNMTLYGSKQANQEYYVEDFDFIVDNLCLRSSIAAAGLFFGGTLGESTCVFIPVYDDDIMIIGKLVLLTSIASRL